MKKKFVLIIPCSLLFATLTSCGSEPISYEGNEWYVSGFGSFVSGAINTYSGGIKLEKSDVATSGYHETYILKDQDFKVGDSIYFTTKNDGYRVNAISENGSFTTKNTSIYTQYGLKTIDILKTGKYTVQVDVNGDNVVASVINGTGTTDNLHPVIPSDQTISLFENGDYHAALSEKDDEIGIFKFASFVKDEMNKTIEEDILLSNGDLWQGRYESNVNHGQMLNEVAEYMNYEAFNIGNHEFDWGQEVIKENKARTTMPYLGANIFNYTTKQPVNYLQPYTVIERNDVKIGVIGTIGVGQWTSITSTQVDDISFEKVLDTVKKYSDHLKGDLGCHAVVLLNHDKTSTMPTSDAGKLANISSVTNKRYVDAFFFGHDHKFVSGYIYNGEDEIPYANSGNNGVRLSHINLNIVNGDVASGESSVIAPSGTYSEDQGVKAIYDKYVTKEIKDKAEEVVGSTSTGFSMETQAPNLMCKAMYDYVKDNGSNVDFVLNNEGRAYIPEGEVNYTQLSDTFPFFNKIVIMSARGGDIKSAARSGGFYMPNVVTIDNSKYYTIATYDYMAYHKSSSRIYDYFPSFSFIKEYNRYPLDILTDYWKAQSSPLNNADYVGEHFIVK